jgi:hypothetical protein
LPPQNSLSFPLFYRPGAATTIKERRHKNELNWKVVAADSKRKSTICTKNGAAFAEFAAFCAILVTFRNIRFAIAIGLTPY